MKSLLFAVTFATMTGRILTNSTLSMDSASALRLAAKSAQTIHILYTANAQKNHLH